MKIPTSDNARERTVANATRGDTVANATRNRIIREAKALGFDVVGFATNQLPEDAAPHLDQFIEQSYHGDMEWMQTHAARRRDIQTLWPEARTAIILGHNYGPDYDPLTYLDKKGSGLISCYAQGKDYHDVIKKKLKALARMIAQKENCDVKVFVDTAPLMEKPLAAQSAIGWQGKHTCLVSREYGSWLFLGEILTTLELPADTPEINHCGSCTRCLDICPTQAFDGAHQLDARKCISYLTIEHKSHIDEKFRKAIGNRIYGCDDCLAVCPWNKFAQNAQEISYHPTQQQLPALPLAELLQLDDASFRAQFKGSPIKRIGRDRFLRNVLIAAGNSQKPELILQIMSLLDDTSDIVRAMAVWALSQLMQDKEIVALAAKNMPNECHPEVLNEWKRTIPCQK